MNVNLVPEHLDKWFPPLLQQIEEAEKKGLPTPSMTNPLAGCFPVIPPGTKLSEIPPGVMMPNLSPSPRPTMPNLPNMPNMPTMPILPNMPVLSMSNMPPMLNRKSLSSISGMPLLTSLKGSIPLSLPNEPIRREDILKMPPSSVSGSHPPIMFPFQNIEKREENLPERDPGFAFKPIFLGPKEPKTASENEKEQQARNEEKIQKMRDELIEAENRRNNTSTSTEYDNSDLEEHEEPQNLSQDKHDAERSPSPVPSLPIKLENDRSYPPIQVPHLPMGLMRLPPRLPFDSNLLLNRLPSIENSDDAWESFIEVDRASETSKLEHFVNSLDHKLSDPNECIVCHKVLSCKSALQMHYRIHTGERPYKCKVCKRCFTTKGNLKTHMSVHRIRAPMRMFHQCLVCHKRYPNNIVLQEHIKTHTGEPTDLTLEQISAAEIKDFPPVGLGSPNNGSSPLFLPSSPFSPGFYTSFGGGDKRGWDDQMRDDERDSDTHSRASSVTSSGTPEDCGREEGSECQPCVPSSKLVRPFLIENPIGLSAKNQPEDLSTSNKNPDDQNHQVTQLRLSSSPEAEDGVSFQKDRDSPDPSSHTTKDSPSPATSPLPNHSNSPSPTGPEGQKSSSPTSQNEPSSPSPTRQDSQGSPSPTTRAGLDLMRPDVIPKSFPMTKSPSPLDLTHGNPLNHYLMANPLAMLGTPQSLLSHLTGGLPPGLNPFAGLGLGLGLPPSPFGFTLGGDRIIGQGTTTCQVCFKVFACSSALEIHMRSHTKIRPFKCPECERGFSTKGNLRQHLMTHSHGEEGGGDDMDHSSDKSDKFDNEDEIIANQADIKAEERRQEDAASSIKRSFPDSFPDGDTLIPLPKRPSGLPKHMCHVCNKNFSSSSAAMIHLRTHTGERPFKCSVCGKGFTTRGNLKVHMSVHMYTSSQASRRGRRMSLDLPPIPMNARDTEFLQRHPDIVLPYLQHRPLPPLSLPSSLGPPSLGKPLPSSLQPPILTSMNSLAPPSLSLSSIANSLAPPSVNLPRSTPTLSMSLPSSVNIPSSALNSRHGEPLSPQMVGLVRSGAGHPPHVSPSLPPRPPYGVFRSLPPSTHDEPEALRIPPSQEYQYGHCESREDKPTNLGRHNQPNTPPQETQTLGSNCLEGKHKHQALQI